MPTKFWLANIPEGTSLISLVRLAKIRWWIEQGYRQLKDELGLDHYEGRTWQGWHHHVMLTMFAFGFLTLGSLSTLKKPSGWRWLLPMMHREFHACWTVGQESVPPCGTVIRWRMDFC